MFSGRSHQVGVVGQDDRLDPVAGPRLGEDARDMGLHRRLGEMEPGGYTFAEFVRFGIPLILVSTVAASVVGTLLIT